MWTRSRRGRRGVCIRTKQSREYGKKFFIRAHEIALLAPNSEPENMQTPSQHHHPAGSPSVVTITATKAATRARWRRLFGRALLAAASLYALPAMAETTVYVLTTDGKLASAPTASPAAVSVPVM